jgi:hypothetical protein
VNTTIKLRLLALPTALVSTAIVSEKLTVNGMLLCETSNLTA